MTGGQGQGQGQEDVCADLQDLELKGGRECSQQHGPGRTYNNSLEKDQ